MIGLLLVLAATFFGEITASIGKTEFRRHKESVFTFGFLSLFWGWLFIMAIGFMKHSFVFSLASLPTFSVRLVLEILEISVAIFALKKADRSTMGFLRIITIPLLLLVDVFLGYVIYPVQIIGIVLIIFSLVILFANHGLRRGGMFLVIFGAINAVITLSLYKYDITHFNSVEAEQGLIIFVLMIYLFLMAFFISKEDPFVFLKKPIFLAQSIFGGLGTVLISFAYLFAPASIITTGKRASSVLWSMLSGNIYFHEKHIVVKVISFSLIVMGLILLVL